MIDGKAPPEKAWDVVGLGANSVDFVHLLPGYPQPFGSFAKMRIEKQEILCGGQTATAMCACARLGLRAKYAGVTGGAKLAPDFLANLQASIARFNGFAKTGKDLDFHRGERVVEQLFNGDVKEEPGRTNPTMWPLSASGPYYAALVVAGTLDTKGGPKTDTHGRVLDTGDKPIPGLYGVGNCVASASGRAYWAGGATLGPIIAFAYRTAQAASADPGSKA